MTDIKNSNQQPTGDDLFSDSETYMKDLSEDELNTVQGGTLATPTQIAKTMVELSKDNPNPGVMGSVMSGSAGGAACYMKNN